MFTLPPDFSHGGIASIPGIMMKQGEMRGVALNGIVAKVTNSYFLVGLSSADADMQRNVQLLREQSWLDIPVVYADGNRALIAIEKGIPGERAFAEAFTAWSEPATAALEPPVDKTAGQTAQEPSPPAPAAPIKSEFRQNNFLWRDFAPVERPLFTVTIAGDRGGMVGDYLKRYQQQVEKGATFRIDGECLSACTLVLAWADRDRVCVTRRAVLGFHQSHDVRIGRITAESRRTTAFMLANYPTKVADYIAAHGGLPQPAGMLWVKGDALRGLVKPCE
jgi:hypothetical protein